MPKVRKTYGQLQKWPAHSFTLGHKMSVIHGFTTQPVSPAESFYLAPPSSSPSAPHISPWWARTSDPAVSPTGSEILEF